MLKKLRILLILSILVISEGTYQYIISCAGGGEYPDETTHSLMQQELIGETPYKPYLFTADAYLYLNHVNDFAYQHYPNTDYILNVNEWSEYMDTTINPDNLRELTDYPDVMKFAVEYFNTKKKISIQENYYVNTEKFIYNPIFSRICRKKDRKTLTYFQTLNALENALNADDYWDYKPIDTSALDSIYTVIETKLIKQKQNEFLKTRYTFLLCKIAFYRENFEKFLPYYNQIKNYKNKTIVKSWCRSYRAGFMRFKGENDSATYEYSRIFDECPEIKQTAFKSFLKCRQHSSYYAYMFHDAWSINNSYSSESDSIKYFHTDFESPEDLNSIEKLFKNNHERATYYGIYLNRSYIPACTEFYKKLIESEADNEWVDVNLMRGVAQLEFYQTNQSSYMNHYESSKINTDEYIKSELQKFSQLVDTYESNKQLKRPWLWTLCAGYLHYLQKDFSVALDYFKKAEKLNINDEKYQNQNKLLMFLCQFMITKKIGPEEEKKAFEILDNKLVDIENKNIIDEILKYMITTYHVQKESNKSNLIQLMYYKYGDFVNQPRNQNIDSVIQIFEKKNPSNFEKFITKISKLSIYDLYRIKGELYIGKYNWTQAEKYFKLANFTQEIVRHPFLNIDENIYNSGTFKINAIDFCKKMSELELKIKNKYANAEEILMYANGIYHISYWGNFSCVTEYHSQSYFQMYIGEKINELYEYPMFNTNAASFHYVLAAQTSKDPEFQAKCYFMAAICEQNKFYSQPNYTGSELSFEDPNYRVYFTILKDNFKETHYYQEKLNECSYLKSFNDMK